jgi:hypothetical protein
VKILPCGEQSVSSVEERNVSDSNTRQQCMRARSNAERPRFQFTGKPGINVDLEDPNNPMEYFELILTSDTAEIIARETNRYANKLKKKGKKKKKKRNTRLI